MLRNSSKFKLIDEDDNEYPIYVVSNVELSFNRVIISKESAKADGGISYDNGRLQESIPISGTLIETSQTNVNDLKNQFVKLQGKVVDFISPYSMGNLRSNKFLIGNITFTVNPGDSNGLAFTMTLREKRSVNTRRIQSNLVNFETASSLVQIARTRLGQFS